MIVINRVVTRSFIVDTIARIKNALGMRITEYENLITKSQESIMKEINQKGMTLKWFRFQITQMTTGALIVMLYGEVEDE